jgi:hypothetical protein
MASSSLHMSLCNLTLPSRTSGHWLSRESGAIAMQDLELLPAAATRHQLVQAIAITISIKIVLRWWMQALLVLQHLLLSSASLLSLSSKSVSG